MSTCRWCTPQGKTTLQFLHLYSSEELPPQEFQAANEDLCFCLECVVDYHQARDQLPLMHTYLWKLETKRLIEHFENALKEEQEEDDELFLIEDEQEIQLHGYTGPDFENNLRVPTLEILKYPYLLLHERLSELFVEALSKMEQVNFSFQAFEMYPGIYLLLVHPNETIRRWAILAAKSLGKVERDDFYDLQEVIACLLKVIELDLFENTDFYNSYGIEEGKLILLPPHLYDVTNHKNYWLGICMLLMVLDEQAMDSLLLAQDKQNDFVKSVLNTMMKSIPDDVSDPFWPALQCFMVILDRLGSKVWGQLIDPTEAFQAIIGSQSYNNEIEKIRNTRNNTKVKYDTDDDNMVSCSQIVYDYNSKRESKDPGWKNAICPDYYPNMYDEMQTLVNVLQCDVGQDLRVHNSTFLWFIPFVNSVMDLKDLGIAYIGEVIHHIYSEIKDVLNRKVPFCDKVTEFFILILVSVVELHRNKNNLHLLWYSSQKWVEALVKCAMLPARVFNQNSEKAAGTSNVKVTSTTFAAMSSAACSCITSSVQQACVQLIRSFLKEGCQSQQRNMFQQFLDKLNRQLRSSFILGWQLSPKEQQELQSCLTQFIKNSKNKTAEMKQMDTVGRGSGLKGPLIKCEKDPEEWGKMPAYYNSGPGPPSPSMLKLDCKSSAIPQAIPNQEEIADHKSLENKPEESSEEAVLPFKTEFILYDDITFLNKINSDSSNTHEEELPTHMTKMETSPPPRSHSLDDVTVDDPQSRQRQIQEQAGGPAPTSTSNVNFSTSSLDKNNLQAEPLEVTHSVPRKEKWKRSMLLEFQESMNKNSTEPEAVCSEKDQHVISHVSSTSDHAGTDCDLPQTLESVSAGPSKFKIDPSKLLNLKVKMQAINLKMKEINNSLSKERTFEKIADAGADNRQSDKMNNRNSSQVPNDSKNQITDDKTTENLCSSQVRTAQLSPISDKRAKSQSSDLLLSPLPESSSTSKFPGLSNPLHSCHSNSSDSDDDIPFSLLRLKLKRRISSTSKVNRNDSKEDEDFKPSPAVPAVSANLCSELPTIQSLNKVDRKVKAFCQGQLCNSIQNKENFESDSTMNKPTEDNNAELITISDSETSKESTSSFIVSTSEAKKKDNATSIQCVSGIIEENQSCLQEKSVCNKFPPVFENDSQFFEFESEEQVYSVWEDSQPQQEKANDKKKTQLDDEFHRQSDEEEINGMLNEWGYDTDYVSDELIEKVAEEAEASLKGEQNRKRSSLDTEKQFSPRVSSLSSSAAKDTPIDKSNVQHSGFTDDIVSNLQNEKEICIISDTDSLRSLIRSDKYKWTSKPTKELPDYQQGSKLTVKNRADKDGFKNNLVSSNARAGEKQLSKATSSKDSNKSILKKQSQTRPDQKTRFKNKTSKNSKEKASLVSLTNICKSLARDVQMEVPSTSGKHHSSSLPKKVRKRPEPTSTVEKLGLKKKVRKAFDLSQGSLDTLNKLRTYGQKKGAIEHKHIKKAKLISPQKLTVRTNQRLLVSQDRQYLRQSKLQLSNNEKKRKCTSTHDESAFPKKAVSTEGNFSFISATVQRSQKHKSASVETDNIYVAAPILLEKKRSKTIDVASTQQKLSSINAVDDLNLTQHDPLDMDVSTDESLDDNELMLTQRDPIDMDIDDGNSEEEDSRRAPLSANETRCQYTGCSDIIVSSEKFCKQHSLNEPKDIFPKPELPPSIWKSPKPTTTKLFASSSTSRNAQLATEMQCVPKRPGGATSKVQQVQRSSVANLASLASKPTPIMKTVETPNVLRTLNKDMNFRAQPSFQTSVTALPTNAPLPPWKSRQASPNVNLDLTEHRNRDQSYLINAVLKWDYQMFDSLNQFGVPDSLCEIPTREVPEKFRSYEEYFQTFYPLLMLNLFEQLAQKLKESKQTNRMIHNSLTLKNYRVAGKIYCAEFQVSLRDHQIEKQLHPKEDDVVFLWLPQNQNYYMQEEGEIMNNNPVPHISHISKTSRFSTGRDSLTTLHLSIQTRGNVSAVKNQPVRCDVIGSLVTTLRQFKGLLFLAKTPLIRPILSANSIYFIQKGFVERPKLGNTDDYNEHQQKAIHTAYAMVKQPRIPNICLIQGPPGTGKSKTIVGLLHRLLNEEQENVKPSDSRNLRSKRTRILVCAPSNAAIDDLMKKIIVDFKSKCKDKNNALGNCGDVNLVRLGCEKAIHSDVMKFSLDYQVNHRIKRGQYDADQRRKDWLDRKLDELGKRCAIIKKDKEQIEMATREKRQLEKEREELGRKLKELRGQTQDMQLNIILEAHIICCTLSTCGIMLLEMSFRKLGHEPFSCIVVDEAGQACETEILIPLIYRCPKLVLVGDHEQLPPTIISMKAKELRYGRSMMCRLQMSLQNEVKQNNSGQSPVIMLLTQYRMHPDICHFPSKYIYRSLLKTDEKTEMQRCSLTWPFQSYMLFDVTDGYECRENDSYTNAQEVKLVIALISMIAEKQKGICRNIGVITPYNAQKQKIMNQIDQESRTAGLEQGRTVQVGTVDGFQGCEKDCIIVTCVRASNFQGSIGFLADRQRLNVTITRARLSLFILGNLKTLLENKDWKALIQDAQKRGAIVKTSESDYKKDCQKILKPRSIVQRSISDPAALTGEQKQVPDLAWKSSWNETSMPSAADVRCGQFPKTLIPSQSVSKHHLHYAQSSVTAQPETSVRSELSAQDKPRDPRLARRALLKETQPQLKITRTFSESRVVNSPDSSASGGGHGAIHSSNISQPPRNSLSRIDVDKPYPSPLNRSLTFPSGTSGCRNDQNTVYNVSNCAGSWKQQQDEVAKGDRSGEQK
ncbi:probable helicase senataxin isoform X1 [Hemiscyllium ocellatum]|uniref:probable helicase senataxin isoform X1 n=2 Tax=Hemiscyllium ocellatum TaxID=170820 RepID=UPI0029670B30|nr:probable helicase senataxin isoform X1 [Hemiscyllium ocellatum]XP_060697455.1 probable helicase senataxin isoform X1 [Hemiscyllium ocellatum]XP_060697456.1 probable helicase senataxin isoform X1 [Hemiscyllium ocellatum]XP_060697457.1 probable helicase senataxin isoform X1 [Hemiscyllium ocellatum]